jgi:hypothetical protein
VFSNKKKKKKKKPEGRQSGRKHGCARVCLNACSLFGAERDLGRASFKAEVKHAVSEGAIV